MMHSRKCFQNLQRNFPHENSIQNAFLIPLNIIRRLLCFNSAILALNKAFQKLIRVASHLKLRCCFYETVSGCTIKNLHEKFIPKIEIHESAHCRDG